MSSVLEALRPRFTAGDVTGRLSLRANFSWTFVGNMVFALCQWGMLTVLAKLGSPEAVGQFSLGLAVGAPVMMLANLQLRQIQATDARHEYAFGDYLALRLATTVLAYGLIVVLAVTAGYRAEVVWVIVALGLQKAFQSMSDVYHGLLQQRERMDRIARSLLLKGPLGLAALAGAYALSRSVAVAALALAGVYAAVWLGYDRRSARLVAADEPLRPRWSRARLLRLTWLALPLGIAAMLASLNTNVPSYTIERQLGEGDLGIYGAMAYIKVAGMYVVAALGQAASPRLAEYYRVGKADLFRRLMLRLLLVGLGLGLMGAVGGRVFGRFLLLALYGPSYAERLDVFVVLMAAAGFSYIASFMGYGLTAMRCLVPRLWIETVSTCLIYLGCIVLLPHMGLMGAAVALLVAAIIVAFLQMVVGVRYFRSFPASQSR